MNATDRQPRFHLSLAVHPARLQAMTDFYATLFGVPPRKRHDDHVSFDLADPPLNLSFVPRASATTGELDHLGIQVFSEAALQRARVRLAATGLPLREEPAVECCYARQDKFWLTDPEGRQVELFHKLADIEHHGHVAAASTAEAAGGTPARAVAASPMPGSASAKGASAAPGSTAATGSCCAPGACEPR